MTPSEPHSSSSPASDWRLSSKIYVSAVVLLALFLVMAAANYFSFYRVEKQFERFAESSRVESQLSEIEGEVTELQRRVTAFTITRNRAAADSIRQRGAALGVLINAALGKVSSEEVGHRLQIMRSNLESYLDNFETVAEERALRNQLVAEELLVGAVWLDDQLMRIARGAPQDANDLRESTHAARTALGKAASHATQFLINPDAHQVKSALEHLKLAKAEIADQVESAEGHLKNDCQEIQEDTLEFERNFLRIVQATRGYLYLVNVVMAGDAAEFSYQAKELRENSLAEVRAIRDETFQQTQQTKRFTLGLSVAAILLGLGIAARVAHNLIGPILSITHAFGSLLKGEEVETIPGLHRGDEIGDMARAADRLRTQSVETFGLLERTKKLAAELDGKRKALEKSNSDLDSFAYIASHDLKSPLRAIDNISLWIAEDCEDLLPEKSREHLGALRQRVGRMNSLLDDILTYSRAGRAQVPAESIDVNQLVEAIPGLIEWPDDATLQIKGSLPSVAAEASVLQRIFLNLIINAAKYRSEKPLEVQVSAREIDKAVEFSVADNGIGIDPQFHDNVFQMFKRLHRQDDIQGTGMGLALVKKLVEAAGGKILVESEKDAGATFRFTWPKSADMHAVGSQASTAAI